MQSFQTLSNTLIRPLINPAQFDFWAQQFGSTRAWQRCFARVVAVTPEGRNTKTLTLKANSNWQGFVAGQHCNVTAVIGGRNISRSYSLSSDPADGRRLQITVRREFGGLMSEYLCNEVRVGERLELGAAFGDMVLPARTPAHLLLLVAGSGITPAMSMARTLARQGMSSPVTLLYWEKAAEDFNFTAELEAIAREHINFNLQLITTRRDNGNPLHGRVTDALLTQIPNIDSVDQAFTCGSAGFVDKVSNICSARGVALMSEAFTPPAQAAEQTELAEYDVYLRGRDQHLRVNNQISLLEQLESAGVAVPSGCRQGICNTCVCPRSAGTTTDIFSGVTDGEPGQQIRLCVSRAAGNLELNI